MRYICFAIGLMLSGCATEATDPETARYLTQLSERTTTYYNSLIRTNGTADCRYSAPPNQRFWRETDGDLRVIGARVHVIDNTPGVVAAFNGLNDAYRGAQDMLRMQEEDAVAGGKAGEGKSPCLGDQAAMEQAHMLTLTATRVSQALAE